MEILLHFVCIETLRVCGKRKYPFIVDLTNFSLQFLQHFFKAVAVQYLWLHLQEIASCLATSSSKSCNQAKQDKTKQLKSKHFRFQHDTLMRQRQGDRERQAGRQATRECHYSVGDIICPSTRAAFFPLSCSALHFDNGNAPPLRLCVEFLVSASISKLAYHA